MKKLVCALMCVLMLLLCACQPTPDEEYVVNKGDNVAEERINATALPVTSANPTEDAESTETAQPDEPSPWQEAAGQAVFPERWEFHIKTQYKEMFISADVVTSGQESYPVRLIRKGSYSENDLIKVAEYLFRDVTGWRLGHRPSRETLTEAMQYVAGSDMPEAEKAERLEELNALLAGTNVSDADRTVCESIEDIPFGSAGLAGITVYMADGKGSMIAGDNLVEASANLTGPVRTKSGYGPNNPDTPQFSVEISLEEAKAKAEEFFAATGIDGFELYFSDEAVIINDYSGEICEYGWQLRFLRSFEYVPFSVSQYDVADTGMFDFGGKFNKVTEYSEPVREENMWLYVNENGVKSVRMSDPYEYVSTVNENVQLCDFDELTMNLQLLFTAAISSPYQSEGYYVIEQMILTVFPVPKKDSSDYYLTPVWVCKIGNYVSLGDGLGVSHFYIPGEQFFEGWDSVAFNAIDGTRISMPEG